MENYPYIVLFTPSDLKHCSLSSAPSVPILRSIIVDRALDKREYLVIIKDNFC